MGLDSLWESLPAGRRSQAAATSKMSHVGGRPKAFPARQVLTNGRHRTAAGTDSRGGRPPCGNSVYGWPDCGITAKLEAVALSQRFFCSQQLAVSS